MDCKQVYCTIKSIASTEERNQVLMRTNYKTLLEFECEHQPGQQHCQCHNEEGMNDCVRVPCGGDGGDDDDLDTGIPDDDDDDHDHDDDDDDDHDHDHDDGCGSCGGEQGKEGEEDVDEQQDHNDHEYDDDNLVHAPQENHRGEYCNHKHNHNNHKHNHNNHKHNHSHCNVPCDHACMRNSVLFNRLLQDEATEGQFWQADHIVPVAEGGGLCGIENLRTLCTVCHLRETADLKKRLKKRRKQTTRS
jgi:hypothetical protein